MHRERRHVCLRHEVGIAICRARMSGELTCLETAGNVADGQALQGWLMPGENRHAHGILGTYSGDGDGDNPLLVILCKLQGTG